VAGRRIRPRMPRAGKLRLANFSIFKQECGKGCRSLGLYRIRRFAAACAASRPCLQKRLRIG
jgi:hypothetical protein